MDQAPSTSSHVDLLRTLESYYDAVPRSMASCEEVGPFTLFVRTDPTSFDFYARPSRGIDVALTAEDVTAVLDRQRALGVGQQLEWVHETTPTLLQAARAAGMTVQECPLLVLDRSGAARTTAAPGGVRVEILAADSPDLGRAVGVIGAGFAGTDLVQPQPTGRRPELIGEGLLVVAAAYDESGDLVGGGSHSPCGTTTELTGIAVLPRARRRGVAAAVTRALVRDAETRGVRTVFLSAGDDTVARVYEKVGFVRVGTACIAELPAAHDASAPAAPDGSVEVVPVGPDQWAAWRAIRLRSLRDAPEAFGSTYEREAAFTEDDFRARLSGDGPAVLAIAGGRAVGMGAGFQDAPGWLHVVAMWVDPAWRGRGIAGQVLDALVGWAEQRGLRIHLDVATGNPAARAVYERRGFVRTGELRPLREGSPDTVERMVLS